MLRLVGYRQSGLSPIQAIPLRHSGAFWLGFRIESQPSRYDICCHLSHSAVMAEGMGAHPDQRFGLRNAELDADHAGGLVDLGPVPGRPVG